jgi:hypothetical protein
MTKSKLLTFAVIALFLINIITLSFLFFKGPRPEGREKPNPRDIVIHKLDFDDTQIASYEELIKKHKASIENLDRNIKKSKNNLYKQLSFPENKSVTDSILNKLNLYKSEIELVHYNHFLDIKKLCKPEQLDNYNELTHKLAKIFAPKGRPKKDE